MSSAAKRSGSGARLLFWSGDIGNPYFARDNILEHVDCHPHFTSVIRQVGIDILDSPRSRLRAHSGGNRWNGHT
jgi:hypothetical protein